MIKFKFILYQATILLLLTIISVTSCYLLYLGISNLPISSTFQNIIYIVWYILFLYCFYSNILNIKEDIIIGSCGIYNDKLHDRFDIKLMSLLKHPFFYCILIKDNNDNIIKFKFILKQKIKNTILSDNVSSDNKKTYLKCYYFKYMNVDIDDCLANNSDEYQKICNIMRNEKLKNIC